MGGSTILRQDDFIKSKLVTVGWQHGQQIYGGHLSSCMIMSVLANRQRAGWGSWQEVIDNIPKYAATVEMPTGSPQIWEPGFVRLLHEVDGIFDGSTNYAIKQSTKELAFYWADLRYIETPFFKEKILAYPELHPRIGEMNSLALFK